MVQGKRFWLLSNFCGMLELSFPYLQLVIFLVCMITPCFRLVGSNDLLFPNRNVDLPRGEGSTQVYINFTKIQRPRSWLDIQVLDSPNVSYSSSRIAHFSTRLRVIFLRWKFSSFPRKSQFRFEWLLWFGLISNGRICWVEKVFLQLFVIAVCLRFQPLFGGSSGLGLSFGFPL